MIIFCRVKFAVGVCEIETNKDRCGKSKICATCEVWSSDLQETEQSRQTRIPIDLRGRSAFSCFLHTYLILALRAVSEHSQLRTVNLSTLCSQVMLDYYIYWNGPSVFREYANAKVTLIVPQRGTVSLFVFLTFRVWPPQMTYSRECS